MGFWQKPRRIFKLEKWVFHFSKTLIGLLSRVEVGFRIYLLGLLESRMEFLYGDAIGVAYLLDPRYLGDGCRRKKGRRLRIVF
jgi:hypothetical protein